MRRAFIVAASLFAAAGFAACGEKPQVTVYQQGEYQGKPDNQPWQSAPFNGDHGAWERAVRARSNGQNENFRMGLQ
ncbi:MAG TPA: hypothetical protein VED01_13050 [Burkholderiales bacterium]|nr:hypothetical protein [Burkholderiales bacterium]